VDAEAVVELIFQAANAVREALGHLEDWGPNPERPGQYRLDIDADRAALRVLRSAGLRVLSEESGWTSGRLPFTAVVDPVDGSTNAHRGIPFFCTSICVFDTEGPWVGGVVDQTSGTRYHAVRGSGSWRDGVRMAPSGCADLGKAVLALSGLPNGVRSWQSRSLGSAALELCAVADGTLDGFVLGKGVSLRSWDYLGGLLICVEAGAAVAELDGRDLWVATAEPRRPAAAGSSALLGAIQAAVGK